MPQPDNTIDAVLEENGLTLNELAVVCAVKTDWIIVHIEEGFLEPLPNNQKEWRFSSASLLRVKRILTLERDFDAVPELAALVADLQEEISKLKQRLHRAGID